MDSIKEAVIYPHDTLVDAFERCAKACPELNICLENDETGTYYKDPRTTQMAAQFVLWYETKPGTEQEKIEREKLSRAWNFQLTLQRLRRAQYL